jgi:phosphoribosylaminoimidazolecarboxamide formyltransferase/IMP cyclohydrolase
MADQGTGNKPRALLSVSDKTGIVPFARELENLGYEILSTGGTAELLEKEGIAVTRVSKVTDFPEILGGRVKTLHPKIQGGILARPDLPSDAKDLADHHIVPIELVCINLYPFVETVAQGKVALSEAVEKIDIGGPTMIRAAAKNFQHVMVVVESSDYNFVLKEIKGKSVSPDFRFELARKAFTHTARYDSSIAQYLHQFEAYKSAKNGEPKLTLPNQIYFQLSKIQDLRYGENPHQNAAYYQENPLLEKTKMQPLWQKLQGKELSFNNILDAQSALAMVWEFADPAAVIVKHTNPCGVAWDGKNLIQAYEDALACDSLSAFGGIVALNRKVEEDLAKRMNEHFFELILAPEFSQAALELLKGKKNLRLLQIQGSLPAYAWDFKRTQRGFLVQDRDLENLCLLKEKDKADSKVRVVSKRIPTADEWQAMDFAWRVVRHVKSNAIVLCQKNRTIGIGAGQMSRVDSSKLARIKAQVDPKGSVLASDAFFPFRDGIDAAAEAGARAIIQPGGSIRDEEVIQAANEHDMAMVFTGQRHFKH